MELKENPHSTLTLAHYFEIWIIFSMGDEVSEYLLFEVFSLSSLVKSEA